MKKRLVSIPQLMFVVSTRAALAAGVALLASPRLSEKKRRLTGLALAITGVATTVPAARMIANARASVLRQLANRFA